MINFLMRPEKVEEFIELINSDKEVKDVVTAIYLQDNFSSPCDICKLAQVKSTI